MHTPGGDSMTVAWQGPGILQQVITDFDLDENCTIDLYEFSLLAQHWMETL